jgi:hypothetical protein
MKIFTNMSLESICRPKPVSRYFTEITKGSSAEIIFDFNKFSYLLNKKDPFKYIEQVTFLFKQKYDVTYFEMLDENKNLTSNFGFDTDDFYISCILDPETTSQFKVTKEGEPMEFEIAIKVNTDEILEQRVDTTIIEKQLPILVVDSIYSQVNFRN